METQLFLSRINFFPGFLFALLYFYLVEFILKISASLSFSKRKQLKGLLWAGARVLKSWEVIVAAAINVPDSQEGKRPGERIRVGL